MSKSLLFGVLDWGLGHAARSVPLLRFFQNNGWIIHIAATGAPRKLLLDALHQTKKKAEQSAAEKAIQELNININDHKLTR